MVEKALKEGGFAPDDTQQIMIIRAIIFEQQKKFDEAFKALDEAKAFAPDSEKGVNTARIKTKFEANNLEGNRCFTQPRNSSFPERICTG